MTTKQDMLKRIRVALGRTEALRTAPTPPDVPDELVRLASAADDLPALFAERARQVGMEVVRCSAAEVATTVIRILQGAHATSVVCTVNPIGGALAGAGIALRDWRNDPSMADEFEADAAVSDVHAALAETGSIVCCADARHGRGISLVPPLHVAIVRHRDIVPDMLDHVRRMEVTSLPSAQAIITGPSKTADIEGVLVTGVHGPGRVVIVLAADG